MARIRQIRARQLLDSRGNPTIEATITTSKGNFSAMVPAGASKGVFEAYELRDGGKRFGGMGVTRAVANVNGEIARKLRGMDVTDQQTLDSRLIEIDGTPQKKRLGANSMLAVSLAAARAGAAHSGLALFEYLGKLAHNAHYILPVPMLNVINGGRHAGNRLNVQEFLILPVKAPSFSEGLRYGVEVYRELRGIISKRYGPAATALGDEGGFAPPLSSTEEALDIIADAIDDSGYSNKVRMGLDCAASEFYRDKQYHFEGKEWSSDRLAEFYSKVVRHYKLLSLEDPFEQEDWAAWHSFTHSHPNLQLVGDDLLATNPAREQRALTTEACNALLLKVNQIGTLSEALEAHRRAREGKWNTIVSHRSGETEDTFIADLVVGLGAGQSKFGAPARGERTAKYNRLLRLEEYLGRKASYARPFD